MFERELSSENIHKNNKYTPVRVSLSLIYPKTLYNSKDIPCARGNENP